LALGFPAGSRVSPSNPIATATQYDGFAYESEITKGVNVFGVSDPRLAGAIRLGHLNPQTEEFALP
jgi:hypothetical protein